jgi:hypothetical protein
MSSTCMMLQEEEKIGVTPNIVSYNTASYVDDDSVEECDVMASSLHFFTTS